MATTATLVYQGHNNLRFLLVAGEAGGGALTITNAVLQNAALPGPLRSIFRAKEDGIGTIQPGTALNLAQARAILCADGSTSVGNEKVPRARMHLSPRISNSTSIADAGVDGDGKPVINVNVGTPGDAIYLDVEFIGGIGA